MEFDSFFDYPGNEPSEARAPQASFLATCSADEWALITAHTDTIRFDPGATVIAEGSIERALVILVRGQLEVLASGRGRKERRIALLSAGAVVGDQGFLDGEPAGATVRAVGDTEVLRLPLQRFEILAAKDPQLGLYLLFDLGRLVSQRLRATEAAREALGR